MRQFLDHETTYRHLLINLEIPPSVFTCVGCLEMDGQFRCLDCYGPHWWCKSCLINSHTLHPFHRPQQWKDGSFENVKFSDLGYVFQLGHLNTGGYCPDEGSLFGDRRLTIIHVNGVFDLCVRFCRCQGSILEHEQLFRHRLFSSTFERPETAFTLDVLDHYGIDSI